MDGLNLGAYQYLHNEHGIVTPSRRREERRSNKTDIESAGANRRAEFLRDRISQEILGTIDDIRSIFSHIRSPELLDTMLNDCRARVKKRDPEKSNDRELMEGILFNSLTPEQQEKQAKDIAFLKKVLEIK